MSIHGFDDSMLQTPRAKHLYLECLFIDGDKDKYGHEDEKFILHKKIKKFLLDNPQKGLTLPWVIIRIDEELHLVDTRCDYYTFIYKGITAIADDYIFLGFDEEYPLFKSNKTKQEEKTI